MCSINSRFKLKVSFSFFFLVSSSSPNLLFGSGFIVHDGNLSHSSSELFLNLFQFSCSSGSVGGSIKGSIFAIGSLDVGSSQLSATQVRKQQYPPQFCQISPLLAESDILNVGKLSVHASDSVLLLAVALGNNFASSVVGSTVLARRLFLDDSRSRLHSVGSDKTSLAQLALLAETNGLLVLKASVA